MNPSEYRYQIEKVYAESLSVNDWLLTDEQFQQFYMIAKGCKSGGLVLDNWKIFLDGGGIHDDFFDWWDKYRPDKLEGAEDIKQPTGERKKSPFDAVKRKVRIE